MEKENGIFEEVTISNNDEATKIVAKGKLRMKLARVGLVLALISTIVTILSITIDMDKTLDNILGNCFFFCMIISYILGGGLLRALRFVKKITIAGWVFVPIFPVDIIIAGMAFSFSMMAFLMFPVIFVGISYIQIKKEYEMAVVFLNNENIIMVNN